MMNRGGVKSSTSSSWLLVITGTLVDVNCRLSMKYFNVVCMDRKHKRVVGFALHLDEQLALKDNRIENSMR